jgi:hypothetical protein
MLSTAFGSADVDKANNEFVGLRVAVKKLYSNSNGYGGAPGAAVDLRQDLIAAGAVPGTLTVTGNALSNSWGGAVLVQGLGNTFAITYNALPKDACIGLLTASGQNMWLSYSVNGAAVAAFPVTPAAARVACADANNANTLKLEAR